MNKILYILVLGALSQTLLAQNSLKFGPVAALNVAWFRYQAGLSDADVTPVVGYQVGGMADYQIAKSIALQPAITYSSVGSKVKEKNETTSYAPAYLNIPLLIALKKDLASGAKIFANTGPYLAIGLGGKIETNGKKSNISWSSDAKENDLKRGDFGWCLGLGFEKNDFQFSLLYQLGITDISPKNDVNNRVVGIRIGYLVGLQ